MQYIIGVDGGGTKTKAVAYRLDDTQLSEADAGFGNLLLGFDAAAAHLVEAIEQCVIGVKREDSGACLIGIYLGLAGVESCDNASRIEHFLQNYFRCRVRVYHDSELAHAALLQGRDGIITISGTGSVSFGRYQGKTARTGGWGHILGDEGSGYWIALQAFRRIAMEQDTGASRSVLSQSILHQLGGNNADDLKQFVYSAGKDKIAAFTPLIVQMAQAFEKHAVDILKRAGKELAVLTKRTYDRFETNDVIPIGVSGGVLTKADLVRESFRRELEQVLGPFPIVWKHVSPTKGACYLGKIEQEKTNGL